MLEVEAKIAVSKSDFLRLKKQLSAEAKRFVQKESADSYYVCPKNVHVRIRKNKQTYTFTIKKRQTIEGIESNLEMEWRIKNIRQWRNLLDRLGLKPSIRKFKKSTVYDLDGFGVELHHVKHLGHFLEIEALVRPGKDVKEAKNDLIKLFERLGYTSKQFEPRSYLELIENV